MIVPAPAQPPRELAPPPISLSISILLREHPLAERAGLAARLGYRSVESWWPWPGDVADPGEIDEFARSIAAGGVALHLLNVSEGDPRHGRRGLAGIPEAGAEFRRNCDSVLRVVERTGARHINVLAGNTTTAGAARGREVLIERLAAFAERAAQLGAGLVVEQLNRFDHPDYLLTDAADALEVVRRVRAGAHDGRIGMLADVYHLGRSGVDPVAFFEEHSAAVGHVQLADVPGRGQPGTGRLPIGDALAELFRNGYDGHVGIEYALGDDGIAGIPSPDELWAELQAARSTPRPQDVRLQGE